MDTTPLGFVNCLELIGADTAQVTMTTDWIVEGLDVVGYVRDRDLQTVPPRLAGLEVDPNGAARAGGFSLHAGVAIGPGERARLERLCRYGSRPPLASERLALTP